MSYCAEKIGLLKGFTNADRSWASDKACDDFRRKKRAILKSLSLNFFSNTALDTEPIQRKAAFTTEITIKAMVVI